MLRIGVDLGTGLTLLHLLPVGTSAQSIGNHQVLVLPALFVATAGIAAAEIPEGPPVTPVSWQVREETDPKKAAVLPLQKCLGTPSQPASVKRVEFQDQRPYGDVGQRTAWLVRYAAVPVQVQTTETSASATVAVSVAFDAITNDLFCAFTDPAPVWPRSGWDYAEIESRARNRWDFSVARQAELQSTLTQVLNAVWREGADPRRSGQIVIRPRWVQSKLRKIDPQDPDGPSLPPDPPCNMWVIEILGTFIMEQHGAPLTTNFMVLRDGDLKFKGGMYLP
jgi:hypothetical protein